MGWTRIRGAPKRSVAGAEKRRIGEAVRARARVATLRSPRMRVHPIGQSSWGVLRSWVVALLSRFVSGGALALAC
ncbi:hypothetical protein GCM10010171_03200 [Actinokineospora fastidiosa]|uniref:Uncharacterized protein n=1 Tax=Actinokineospora fastidiosa TaxID=1816 RepID=A0A918G2K6_9PSEU|nr:hypothetical protein GCM10010171_03200 [Actinokineospora fastidiosa]